MSEQQQDIIRYWQAVELLQPQAAPQKKKRDALYQAFFHDVPAGAPVTPWSPESDLAHEKLPKDCEWSHTLFGHLYGSWEIAAKLDALFGSSEGYKEPQRRESALFTVKFDAEGFMVDDSLVLSSEAWFLGRAMAGKDWSRGFESDQDSIGGKAKENLGGVVTADGIARLTVYIRQYLGLEDFFGGLDTRRHRFRAKPVKRNKPDREDDPLNSFVMQDLADVADRVAQSEISAPLNLYLQRHDPASRFHVDGDQTSLPLIERLSPASYATGCWPSEQHRGLVHSQQLAVNSVLGTLTDGAGLLGINGPPGTGKTTLLRDLIAAVVTQRADVLASLRRASDAFVKDGREVANDGGRQQVSHRLSPRLYGFEMVVASSNNGAVENVTLELPQRDRIDAGWLAEADYFSELGEQVTGKPAWGLISAALGSKAKRETFVRRFFFGDVPAVAELNETQALLEADGDIEAKIEAGDSTVSGATAAQGKPEKGFLGWLNRQAETSWTTESRLQAWQAAVSDYVEAKRKAEEASARASKVFALIEAMNTSRHEVASGESRLEDLGTKRSATIAELAALEAGKWASARDELRSALDVLQRHRAARPGLWALLFSLWSAGRRWEADRVVIDGRHVLAQADFDQQNHAVQRLRNEQSGLDASASETRRQVEQARQQAARLKAEIATLATSGGATHLLAWLETGVIGRGAEIELAEPWIIDGWRQARAAVFVEALKLHRTFFEIEAKRIRTNLFFATSLLTSGRFLGVSRDAIRSAWASLFMVVPVLSSTFASFARSFGTLEAGEIGWLFVDEAGQATPQAAVGALWRSRRAVLVGDPLQLQPIVTVSDAVLEHLRTHYRVDPHWLPNRQSAQTLADEATRWGKSIGPRGQKRWAGLPLVVHRRCDRPMFELANRIAYDGTMVYGTLAPKAGSETRASLLTGWIDATGTSTGNWVPAEGETLRQLLGMLDADGVPNSDISVITPFQDVRTRLPSLLPANMVSGTIHTMQGKEAAVVIMVLGGSASSAGARNWAVSTPNLLNVAATRAKRRFYVIGDRRDWAGRSLFCEVMDLLPERRV